jgi:hypothetical protein
MKYLLRVDEEERRASEHIDVASPPCRSSVRDRETERQRASDAHLQPRLAPRHEDFARGEGCFSARSEDVLLGAVCQAEHAAAEAGGECCLHRPRRTFSIVPPGSRALAALSTGTFARIRCFPSSSSQSSVLRQKDGGSYEHHAAGLQRWWRSRGLGVRVRAVAC